MFATMETIHLLEQADELSAMIIHSEIGDDYRTKLKELEEDKEAQALISEFVKMKERYEEVQRFGKYHPDFKLVTKEIRRLKREVDLHGTIWAFKQAEKELQNILDEISVEIGSAVSAQIKVPTGNPFFDTMSSCGGGCGAGGSCGCS
ncbi:YlbF family regulator [Priestia endophytica]|jgi:cell fate (sporulation/competence/biofilm development) regulator YlbF (YheA/YmcA/DUF963 family)|uniref:Regulator n=1 Tax=Priestia endophytica TaxID=135735 RepID=A0AAX1QFB6_9BACI|nr:YlbF family regulator [Priestia endophytica]MCM3539391.1 YlbF family regulator [Priestia endophytica]MED4070340.1 YlbF family regulator [Priestia endophytica]RAS79398.1 regulator [Priestia endophytica]RAS79776.1 regulator [Priestia endophytica]RAS84071.1 regulator [Priestia endophytica]